MLFTVTYRVPDGALRTETVEASCRSDCFAKMKALGITPVSVKGHSHAESRYKNTKHRNGAYGVESKLVNKIFSPSKSARIYISIAAGLLLLAGLLWIALKETNRHQRKNNSETIKRSAFIKEVKPAAAPKPVASITHAARKKPDILEKTRAELARIRARMRNASPESIENLRRKEADLEKLLVDKKMQFYMTNIPHVAYQPFKTSTEQVMDWIFNCSVGDDPPPFVPPLDPGEMANIGAILDRANEVVEEDTPDTMERKKMVELAKQELKQYIAQGGNASEFLHYYHQQLVTAYELRMDASRVVREYARDAAPEDVRKFLKETNKVLADKGIGPVMLSDKMKEKIGISIEEKNNER